MPSSFCHHLRRLHFLRTVVLLFVTLWSLSSSRLAAIPARDTFKAEIKEVEIYLSSLGYPDFNSAPPEEIDAAFEYIAYLFTPGRSAALRAILTACPLLPGASTSYTAGISQVRPNGDIFVIGRGDLSSTLRPSLYYGIGQFQQTPTGQSLTVTPKALSLNFPATATDKLFTGLTLDGSFSYGYYNQTGNAIITQPFIVSLDAATPSIIPLPMTAGDTGDTVSGGTPTGSVLVGDAYHGTGLSRTITTSLWTGVAGGSYSLRNIGGYPGVSRTYSFGISGDGSAVLGYYFDAQNHTHAYRWTQATSHIDLGYLPGQTDAQAYASTTDGSKVVGFCGTAFFWTQAVGMKSLPNLPAMPYSGAFCISSDGAFLGGSSYDAAFTGTAQLWTDTGNSYNLRLLLHGLGADTAGWILNQITAIVKNSDESYNISGNGKRNGVTQGFVFQLYASSGRRPAIAAQPQAQAASAGGTAVFSVIATDGAFYQWQRNGVNVPAAATPTLTIANAQTANAGNYTCLVTNAAGTVTTAPAALTVAPTVARLTNLSVRSTAGTGANTLIVGLTISGGTKQILFRGVGATLGLFGVPATLADPQLALFNSTGVQIAQNDDWGGGAPLTTAFANVGAFALPAASKDSALLATLAAGGYSAQVSGAAGTTGVVLVESYDSDPGSPLARYTNLSARNQVGTGANILIVGFNITGNGPKNLLIRGVGLTLGQFGVPGALADPQLALFNSSSVQIGQNDDWGGGASLAAAFTSVGAFALPAASKDSALLVTLQPGSYTAQVSGVNNSTGVALVEIYELP